MKYVRPTALRSAHKAIREISVWVDELHNCVGEIFCLYACFDGKISRNSNVQAKNPQKWQTIGGEFEN